MTKLFTFINPSTNHQILYKFFTKLIFFSNSQRIHSDRFKSLIQRVNEKNESSHKPDQSSLKSSSKSTSLTNLANLKKSHKNARKLYVVSDDLQQDLVECECDGYMKITNGSASLLPNFRINT